MRMLEAIDIPELHGHKNVVSLLTVIHLTKVQI
jgi:hypothetical protein